jgi:hypothetical protein
MVKLERILGADHSDLRASVLAIRTALEVSGDLRRQSTAPPIKRVQELTVSELDQLISETRRELAARQRPDSELLPAINSTETAT